MATSKEVASRTVETQMLLTLEVLGISNSNNNQFECKIASSNCQFERKGSEATAGDEVLQ